MAVYEKVIQQESDDVKNIILSYKTKLCSQLAARNNQNLMPYSMICSNIRCTDYHSAEERRRSPFDEKTHVLLYQPFPCMSLADETICPDGDKCKLSHSQNEIDYHPLTYKTEPCIDNSSCIMNGSVRLLLCPKYHNEAECRIDNKLQLKGGTPKKIEQKPIPIKGHYIALENQQQMPIQMQVQQQQQLPIQMQVQQHQQLQLQYPNFGLNDMAIRFANNKSKKFKGIFDLEDFKTKQCPNKSSHNPKFCIYYHHAGDRRRKVKLLNDNNYSYCSDLCPEILLKKVGMCSHNEKCLYALNKVEQLYHPERYRKKFCSHYPTSISKCEYSEFCSFAHNEDEINIELLHNQIQDDFFNVNKYKTIFCPFITEHDRSQCVYAHNVQDFRRNPSEIAYLPIQCNNWISNPISSYDEGGCPLMQNCNYCHGWKELDYHPTIYKTKMCTNGTECIKKDCAFYHSNKDRTLNGVMPKMVNDKKYYNNRKPDHSKPDNFTRYKNNNNTNGSKFSKPENLLLSSSGIFKDEMINMHANSTTKNININNIQAIDFKKQNNSSNFPRPFLPSFMVHNRSGVIIDHQGSRVTNQNESSRISEKKISGYGADSVSSRNNSNYSSDESFSEAKPKNNKHSSEIVISNFKERLASPLSTCSDKAHSTSSGQKPLIARKNQIFIPGNHHIYNSDVGSGKEDISLSNQHKLKKNVIEIGSSLGDLSGPNPQLMALSSPQKLDFDTYISPILKGAKSESFGQKLIRELKKNGLEHCVQIFTKCIRSFDDLKSFTVKDYERILDLSKEEIQKVIEIVTTLKEDEEESLHLFNEINLIDKGIHTNLDDNNSNQQIYENFKPIEITISEYQGIPSIQQKISQSQASTSSNSKSEGKCFFNQLNFEEKANIKNPINLDDCQFLKN